MCVVVIIMVVIVVMVMSTITFSCCYNFDISKFRRFFPDFKWKKSLSESIREFIQYNEDNFKDVDTFSFEDQIIEKYLHEHH